jgi:hypothetical protein
MNRPSSASCRRPVFIYLANLVGGTEYMYLRRAESARRLGLDPVIITVPGPMDEAYLRTAKVIHLDPKVFGRFAFTHGMAEELADELAAILGREPCHIEATGMPAYYFGDLTARRIPGSECLLHATAPSAVPLRRPFSWSDLWRNPIRFYRAIRGRLPYCEIKELAESGRFLSVNDICVETSAAQLGLKSIPAKLTPLSVASAIGQSTSVRNSSILTAARLDGKMKAYVEGLIRRWPEVITVHPNMSLIIVGDGPARHHYEQLVSSLGISSSVSFFGSLDNSQLSDLYASAAVFVGMGTAAIEAGFFGTPTIIAVEGEAECLSPGYLGDPLMRGYGEKVHGQSLTPLLELLLPLLDNQSLSKEIGERGQGFIVRLHHPDSCDVRLAALLSESYGKRVEMPAPMIRPRQVLANLLTGRLSRRPLAVWAGNA